MAAFLNKPSDFELSSYQHDEVQIKLLPPSEFEKPTRKASVDTPWQELKKAADEILALTLENQKLRDQQQASNVCNPIVRPMSTEERNYADELIARQAEEITKLRCEVQRLSVEKQATEESSERCLAALQKEKDEAIRSMKQMFDQHEGDHEHQLAELNQEHLTKMSDLEGHLEHLSKQLDQAKSEMAMCSAMLTRELETEREKAKMREAQQEKKIQDKDLALQDLTQQLQQLKIYVADTEELHKPQQVWRQECEMLRNHRKILEAEKATLESSIQLMEVQLSSMKEILITQETDLYKVKEQTTEKNKMKELLLTKWRQKVYSLLVQQKSAELVAKQDLHKWQEKMSGLQDQLSSVNNTISILQHTLAAKEAELKMASSESKKLKEEVLQVQQAALCSDTQMADNRKTVQMLAEFAISCEDKTTGRVKVVQQALAQLRSLGQRVSFASSRMDMIKSQLVRKNALKQLDLEETSSKAQQDPETIDDWRVERDQLKHEFEVVVRERDVLATQLKQDSKIWAEKLASVRARYEEEVNSLKRSVEDLETINQNKSQQLEQMAEQAETSRAELAELTERVEELRTELARHQNVMEQALEHQKSELESEWAEQLAEMERRLNEARREHTKAVVTLRQQERRWMREKEHIQEMHATSEAHFQSQLSHMQEQLCGVEKERNLFMATLRQEGLLGRLRSERGDPARLPAQEQAEGEPSSQSGRDKTKTDYLPQQKVLEPSQQVSALLEDLKSLAPAVFDDSLESSDED